MVDYYYSEKILVISRSRSTQSPSLHTIFEGAKQKKARTKEYWRGWTHYESSCR